MHNPSADLSLLCKDVSLKLCQDDISSIVDLMGDILSEGRLIISSPIPFKDLLLSSLQVSFLEQNFSVAGFVENCSQIGKSYLLYFRLSQEDNLQTRMLLQLSEIEQYRDELLAQGRQVTIDEAACEWIRQFAKDFGTVFDGRC